MPDYTRLRGWVRVPVGERAREPGRLERVREVVAAEAVERLAIAADEDQSRSCCSTSATACHGIVVRLAAAGEDGADAGEDQAAARLRRFVGHRRRRAEVAAIGADDAMAGFDRGKGAVGEGGTRGGQVFEPRQHLVLDLGLLLGQPQCCQRGGELGHVTGRRRCGRLGPPLVPCFTPRIDRTTGLPPQPSE